ncbi:MAG: histidine kinase N-terminal 7TM domain-containing protein, partial [Bacteroidota bacterium]
MTFTIYGFFSLLATVTNIIFGTFVLLKNPRSPINRLWSLTIACVIPWGFSEFIMRTLQDYETAELISRLGGIGFCMIPSFFLHFALVFCKKQNLLQRDWIYPILYLPGVLFSIFEISGFVTEMIHLPHGYTRTPAELYPLYLVWLELYFATGLIFCYQKFRKAPTKHERYQTLFVFLAVVIPLGVGSVNDALLPLLGRETLRISVLSTTLTAGLITYAIVRFQLMALTPQATAGNILRTMGDLLAVLDERGHVQYTNPSFQQTLGFSPPSVEPFHMRHFVREADEILSHMKALLRGGEITRSFHVSFHKNDGATIPVSLLVSAIVDQGENVGYVLLARDIREELRLQQELAEAARQREEMLRLYAGSVQKIQEEERQRIARELHDDLCQRLSAVRLEMDMVELDLMGR